MNWRHPHEPVAEYLPHPSAPGDENGHTGSSRTKHPPEYPSQTMSPYDVDFLPPRRLPASRIVGRRDVELPFRAPETVLSVHVGYWYTPSARSNVDSGAGVQMSSSSPGF